MAEESGRRIYTEERNAGNKYREKQLAEILELIEERKKTRIIIAPDISHPIFQALKAIWNLLVHIGMNL